LVRLATTGGSPTPISAGNVSSEPPPATALTNPGDERRCSDERVLDRRQPLNVESAVIAERLVALAHGLA
jgi:hypothetical protein